MKNFICFYLIAFLVMSIICQAQDMYDVETLPTLRTKQYSIAPYKQITIFSAPRTGSSLIYNIFRFLFEEDSKLFAHHDVFTFDRLVLKTHLFTEMNSVEKENTLCIFTFRNPLDASISNYRITTRKDIRKKAFAQELINRHCNYLLFSEEMEKDERNVLRIKYENFADDLDFVLNLIENKFQITIDLKDKELIKLGYSKENIYNCIMQLDSFNEYLPFSGFHGQHISSQESAPPPPKFLLWLNIYLKDAIPLFRNYGYFLDNFN